MKVMKSYRNPFERMADEIRKEIDKEIVNELLKQSKLQEDESKSSKKTL